MNLELLTVGPAKDSAHTEAIFRLGKSYGRVIVANMTLKANPNAVMIAVCKEMTEMINEMLLQEEGHKV